MVPILLAASLLGSSADSGPELRVVLDLHLKRASVAKLIVTAQSVADPHELLSAPQGEGYVTKLRVPHRGNWILTCRGEGYWCPRLEVGVYDTETERTLPVFRAARASGRIEVPRGLTAPPTLTLQGRMELQGAVVELVETVAVSKGRFALTLPGETIDLRSTSAGWAPHYWWSLDCRGGSVDLGTLALRPGSSVSGLVVDSETQRPQSGVRATLELKTDLDPSQHARLRAAALSAVSDSRGFFQITGVDPGQHQMELRRGNEPETFMDTVEVPPDAEVYLGRIGRRKPVSVTFEVRPPRDGNEEAWRLVLQPLVRRVPGQSGERALKVDREGKAGVKNLNPDSYEVLVVDSKDSRFLRTEVELHADTHLALDVPLVEVVGRVVLGDRPLSASVALYGMEADQADFTSDADGRFSGWMRRPSAGLIVARVESTQPRVERRIWMKDIHEEDGKLRLEIRLEDFAVRGRVVDEDGRPLKARVDAESSQERSSVSTDQAGRFELGGLAVGRYQVVARRGDRPQMSPQEVELGEDAPSRDLVLVVPRGRVLQGRVLSAEGQPVPGAGIVLDVLGQAPADQEATTELDGSFRVSVSEDAASAQVSVFSRAFPLLVTCVSLPQDEELTLRLAPQPSASVELLVPEVKPGEVSEDAAGRWVLFSQEGGVFWVDQLTGWEFQRSGRLPSGGSAASGSLRSRGIVTGLPSGSYALTRSSLPWGVLVNQTCNAGPPAGVAWTAVAGGDTATIRYSTATAGSSQ